MHYIAMKNTLKKPALIISLRRRFEMLAKPAKITEIW